MTCVGSRIEVIVPNIPCPNIDHLKYVCPSPHRFELNYSGASRTTQRLLYPVLWVIYYLVVDSLAELDVIHSLLFCNSSLCIALVLPLIPRRQVFVHYKSDWVSHLESHWLLTIWNWRIWVIKIEFIEVCCSCSKDEPKEDEEGLGELHFTSD